MGKCRMPSVKIVQSWIDKGYGQGEGKDYTPFLYVRDVPSSGRSRMLLGLKTGRIQHYLSDVEFFHHILAEFSPQVIDIREQYALLPWGETQEIARKLGFRHPTYPGTRTPIVMTSDLVLTTTQESLAVLSVKRASQLKKCSKSSLVRTLKKLRIEQEYWKRRGASWKLSTENDISLVKVENLSMLRMSMVSRELDWLMPFINKFVRIFNMKWHPKKTLSQILVDVGAIMHFSADECFCLFGRAVWLKLLPVNLETRIDHFLPVISQI